MGVVLAATLLSIASGTKTIASPPSLRLTASNRYPGYKSSSKTSATLSTIKT